MVGLVAEWGSLGGHDAYAERLREQHRRKRSFWERYDSEPGDYPRRAAQLRDLDGID